MNTLRLFTVLSITVVVLAVAPFAGSVFAADAVDEPDEAEAVSENASMGTQVGSFMQSSSTNAERSIEDEMFAAAFENADDQAVVLEQREQTLDERVEAIEQRQGEFDDDHSSDVRQSIEMSGIASELHHLERDVETSRSLANETDHSLDRFNQLERDTMELRSSAVAGAAANIPGGPSPGELGPPEEVSDADERTGSGDDEETEPSDDRETEPGNDIDAAPGE